MSRLTRSSNLVCAALALLLLGCDSPTPTPEASAPAPLGSVEAFRCDLLLIAEDKDTCTGDVVGPGELTLTFRPDPRTASWEIAVEGLTAVTQECAFHGRFDQTRLSALQGRGEIKIVCPIDAAVDRQYHSLGFTVREPTPNTTLRVQVAFRRPGT
ncbi:MAG: hypothetical protein AB7I04_17955 [Pseudomonadales bacterium]